MPTISPALTSRSMWSTATLAPYRLVSSRARITTSPAIARPSAAAETGDGKHDDEQRDRDDRDADRAPQGRGQHGDAEIRRFREAAGGAGADRRLVVAGDRLVGRDQRHLDVLRRGGGKLRQLLGIEFRFPALRRRRAELDVARRLGAIVAQHHGQLTALAGISLAAEPTALAGQTDARLPDDGQADRQLGA